MTTFDKDEALIYALAADPNIQITDRDRVISEAVYKYKRHLGPRGMIECALAVARGLVSTEGRDTNAE